MHRTDTKRPTGPHVALAGSHAAFLLAGCPLQQTGNDSFLFGVRKFPSSFEFSLKKEQLEIN
jgi:hypothetical protein